MVNSDYQVRNAGQAWSFTSPTADVLRFEVRDQDYYASDLGQVTSRERSDVVFSDQYANGVPVHVNFDMAIESAKPVTTPFIVLAQFAPNLSDGSSAQSVFDIDLIGGVMMAFVRYTDANGAPATKQIFSDIGTFDLSRGVNIDVKTVFDAGGNGRLVLSRDGVVIADYSGPLGYANQTSASWGEGIVRSASATDVIAADFGNLKIAVGDTVTLPEKTVFLDAAPIRSLDGVFASDTPGGGFFAKISGSSFEGAHLSFYLDGVVVGTAVANASGKYLADVPVASTGSHNIVVVATNASGQNSVASVPAVFRIDDAINVAPTDANRYFLTVDGELFNVQTPNKDWSLTSPQEGTLRFEVHDNDTYWWDTAKYHTSERSEIASEKHFANGTAVEVSYGFMLEPGEKNTATYLVTGQLHFLSEVSQPYSPPFSIGFEGERMMIVVRYSQNGAPVEKKVFVDSWDIVRGQVYDLDIKAVFDPTGEAGRVVVIRDGVTVVDYSGPLGYDGQTAVYWKEGVYRNANATETIAVQFSDLSLKSGAAVVFPDKSDFVTAPLMVGHSVASGLNGLGFAGDTKANATVFVYDGTVLIGTTVADASGHFTIDLAMQAGRHELMTKVVDAAGHSSALSAAMRVEVTTAADFTARMDALSRDASIIAIQVTDTSVITLTSANQVWLMQNRPQLLTKVQGEFSFFFVRSSTNPAYDRQEEVYNSAGVMTDKSRFLAGQLLSHEVTAVDGTKTTTFYAADGKYDIGHYLANGAMTGFDRYTSSGLLYNSEVRSDSGLRVVSSYDMTTGVATGVTTTFSDGHKLVVTLNVVGQNYVRQDFVYDKAGKPIDQKRSTVDGTTVFWQKWSSDGSIETHKYDAVTGAETFLMVKSADGTYFQKAYVTSGINYSIQQNFYSATNKLVGTDTFDTSGKLLASVRSNTDGSKTVFTVDADGTKLGYVQTFADASKTIVVFAVGRPDLLAKADHYSPAGQLVETHIYDQSGREVSVSLMLQDGSHQLDTFNISGVLASSTIWKSDGSIVFYTIVNGLKTGMTTTDADGSYMVTKFVPGSESMVKLELHYAADGRFEESNSYSATTGKLERTEVRQADGSGEWHQYNPVTGAETGYTIRHADKSRIEANLAVTGKDYVQQIATYDGAGKTVEMIRRYGDENHTLAFSQKLNADGSSEVHNYDIHGRETVRIITDSNGSRDAFTFTYSDAVASSDALTKSMMSATQSSASTHTHFGANNVKQWVDDTKADGSHIQYSFAQNVTLTSHEGVKDTFMGMKGGADTFVFNAHFGKDTVVGFEAGSAKHDVLAFDADLIPDYAHLQAMMTKVGNDTLITVSPSDSVLIKSVAPSSLVADDFRFIHHQDGLNL